MESKIIIEAWTNPQKTRLPKYNWSAVAKLKTVTTYIYIYIWMAVLAFHSNEEKDLQVQTKCNLEVQRTQNWHIAIIQSINYFPVSSINIIN